MTTLGELSDLECKVIERMRMTPEQQQAELAALKAEMLAKLPESVRQARIVQATRVAAMTVDQRRAWHLGQHLVASARMLRDETERGAQLADVLNSIDANEMETLTWLCDALHGFVSE